MVVSFLADLIMLFLSAFTHEPSLYFTLGRENKTKPNTIWNSEDKKLAGNHVFSG